MSRLKLLSIVIVTLFATAAKAQLKIGDNPNTIIASSALEIESTDKGVLIPRMTKAQKNAIATPSTGLLVFQNAPDSVGFHYYNGTEWVWLQNSAEGWSTNGNNNITASNFLGTINNQALKFKVFNQEAGIVDSTTADVALGFGALKTAHSGPGFYANNAFGFGAGQKLNSGYGNVAIGRHALSNTGASIQNIAIGDSAMGNAIASQTAIAIGYQALKNYNGINSNTHNIAIGYLSQSAINSPAASNYNYFNTSIGGYAMANNVSGNNNTAIGISALRNNVSTSEHIAIGYNTLINHTSNNYNVAIGNRAMESDTSGFFNVAIGVEALSTEKNSESNMAIGFRSLKLLQNGSANTAIGVGAMEYKDSAQECTAIGRFALGGSPGLSTKKDTGSVAIGTWAGRFNNASYNTFLGYYAGRGANAATPIIGNDNVGVGSFSLFSLLKGKQNVAIGRYAGGINRDGDANIFIGYNAGNKSTNTNSNRLYIENSDADSANALIYGNFASDSLVLNANVNVRDFTRLGAETSGAPAIKMKKLTGTNGAASATTSFAHGLTQSKILSVSVFITSSVTGNDLAPRSTYPGFEYDYYVSSSAIVIRNIAANDGSITGGQVRILITYEE